ncbi:MAG: NUDIX domain-containing protein [Actinomycetota bacterium]|nr:NUDIX domain-containing protein [Actinomycetota bacterium]
MTAVEPIHRSAARVLLVDGRDRVLLFRGRDPGRPDVAPYWFTVGGGLEPGESVVQGALRETREETGLLLAPADLVGPVWHEVTEFPFEGVRYRQEQNYFLARVEAWTVDISAFEEVETRSIDRHRWWSIAELARTAEVYYPVELHDLLRKVLATADR